MQQSQLGHIPPLQHCSLFTIFCAPPCKSLYFIVAYFEKVKVIYISESSKMVSNNSIKLESKECLMKGSGYCPQPLEAANSFLSKKWTISIITTIGNFKRLRFNDILNRVEGITGKTLAERLKELEKLKLAKRIAYKEIPPRVEYELTSEGRKLMGAIIPLIEWSANRK